MERKSHGKMARRTEIRRGTGDGRRAICFGRPDRGTESRQGGVHKRRRPVSSLSSVASPAVRTRPNAEHADWDSKGHRHRWVYRRGAEMVVTDGPLDRHPGRSIRTETD